ncbi:unnamed protein product [Mesocestoides corti]|uniref:Uncharacterized protein n=1 Tax=Mesocestoides corti TaxID=53468 RepID=A0A0R3UKG6_MESCO|nr:unnamed protein product [Mesocestoides corti]
MEARVCRAFELSRWLERHYPTKSNRWTPSRIGIADRRDGNGGGVADEKTPRTRRRDARRAALRSQKCGRHPTGATAAELNHSPESWSAHQIARHFQHITGEEAKRISSLIESWQLGDRQRLLDTSLSLSKLNALGGAVGNQRAPPPRPPETYRQQLQPQNKSNSTQSDQPKRDFREASKTPKLDSSKFTAFWRRQEVRKHEGGARRRGSREDEKHELIETAAELKWLIAENSRLLADLCNEEKWIWTSALSDRQITDSVVVHANFSTTHWQEPRCLPHLTGDKLTEYSWKNDMTTQQVPCHETYWAATLRLHSGVRSGSHDRASDSDHPVDNLSESSQLLRGHVNSSVRHLQDENSSKYLRSDEFRARALVTEASPARGNRSLWLIREQHGLFKRKNHGNTSALRQPPFIDLSSAVNERRTIRDFIDDAASDRGPRRPEQLRDDAQIWRTKGGLPENSQRKGRHGIANTTSKVPQPLVRVSNSCKLFLILTFRTLA